MAKFKIVVDKETCIGCGTCAVVCPEGFEMEGDKAKPVSEEVAEVTCHQEAADACPVTAITISES